VTQGTWLEDPDANANLQAGYKATDGLNLPDSERRQIAHKIVGNSKFNKESKRGRSPGGAKDKYLSYPVARTSDEKTGDTIRIKCVEYVPPDTAGFGITVDNVFKTPKDKEQAKKEGLTTISDKERTEMGLDPIKFDTDFTDANSRINQNLKTKYYIELPIPQEVNDSNSVTWGEDRVNAIELATLSLAQKAMEGAGSEGPGIGQIAQAGIQAFSEGVNIPGLNQDSQKALRAAISGYAINQFGSQVSSKSVIARSTGQILNNNLELLFSGVNLRSFPFSFTFSPRSPKESDVVKAIIRSLKMSMAAKAGEFNGSAQGIFLKSPDLFQLDYLKDGSNHPFLNRFKLTALTGMSVNYTNAGTYASYNDGTPVNIRMNLTFKEINPIYHEDYNEATSGTGVGF
tara:strand:- start:1616 stop:2818 length:1203 start_codon:yes stop_codon:yes gene_type:complete